MIKTKGSLAYRFTVVVDVPVDGDGDDRGVAVPGQVDGVCRYPL